MKGKKIGAVTVIRESGDHYLPGEQRNQVVGARINSIFRRGKFMIFDTNQGTMTCHNAMSGYWDVDSKPWTFDYVEGRRSSTIADVRVAFAILPRVSMDGSGTDVLRFHDSRLFGRINFYPDKKWFEVKSLTAVGPEICWTNMLPPDVPFVVESGLLKVLERSKLPIKQVMMDQRHFPGAGNIYVAEALWRAKISPLKPASKISAAELHHILIALRDKFKMALDGKLSYDHLMCYGRAVCNGCWGKISQVEIAKRKTWFCPTCQVE